MVSHALLRAIDKDVPHTSLLPTNIKVCGTVPSVRVAGQSEVIELPAPAA